MYYNTSSSGSGGATNMTLHCLPSDPTCNYDQGSPNLFLGHVVYSQYNYNIDRHVALIFLAVFGASTGLHVLQAVLGGQWWLLYTVTMFGVGETLGWMGRYLSAKSTVWYPEMGGYWYSDGVDYMTQICCLIISPTLAAAANYLLLGKIAPRLGLRYMYIHPTSYTVICIAGDILSIAVQAVGGGIAAGAVTAVEADYGARIMLGGVFIQLAVMCCYSTVLTSYIARLALERPVDQPWELFTWWPNALRPKKAKKPRVDLVERLSSTRLSSCNKEASSWIPQRAEADDEHVRARGSRWGAKIELGLCCASTVLVFVRSVYRCIELFGGWNGPVISNQTLFNYLDGMLMALVAGLYNIAHPTFFLRREGK